MINSIPQSCGQFARKRDYQVFSAVSDPFGAAFTECAGDWNLLLYKFLEATVADHMTRSVKSVSRDMTMRELEDQFERDDYNAYPVVENARAIGLVTKYDFLNCFAFHPTQMLPHYDDLMNRTVGDIMTPDFIYVHADTKLTRVLQLMVEHQTRSIPVLEVDRKLDGIISREDVIKALASFTKTAR